MIPRGAMCRDICSGVTVTTGNTSVRSSPTVQTPRCLLESIAGGAAGPPLLPGRAGRSAGVARRPLEDGFRDRAAVSADAPGPAHDARTAVLYLCDRRAGVRVKAPAAVTRPTCVRLAAALATARSQVRMQEGTALPARDLTGSTHFPLGTCAAAAPRRTTRGMPFGRCDPRPSSPLSCTGRASSTSSSCFPKGVMPHSIWETQKVNREPP